VRTRWRWASRNGTPERPAAIAELRAEQRKRVAAIRKLNARYAGRAFPMRAAEKWNRLSRELDETEELIHRAPSPLRAASSRSLMTTPGAPDPRSWVSDSHAALLTREEIRTKIRKCRFGAGESVSVAKRAP